MDMFARMFFLNDKEIEMEQVRGMCTVDEEEITLDEISAIMANQRNTGTLNERGQEKSAFDVALKGSKVYLEAHHFGDKGES